MNIDFPKKYSNILNEYNISKEPNKNKSFLLELDNIPEFIYCINNKKEWLLAQGKNGLYKLIDSNNQLSLNEIYHKLENVPYDFIIGYLKEEQKYLAKHPISGKMTEWEGEEDYFLSVVNSKKRCLEAEPAIAKSAYAYLYALKNIKGRFELAETYMAKWPVNSYLYAKSVLKGRFELAEAAIAKDKEYSYKYAKLFNLKIVDGKFVENV